MSYRLSTLDLTYFQSSWVLWLRNIALSPQNNALPIPHNIHLTQAYMFPTTISAFEQNVHQCNLTHNLSSTPSDIKNLYIYRL